jgi:histidinol phosphatase-like PHP family hydrolase
MMYDLHTHSLHSDGELLPIELIRRAAVLGYTSIGITDHVDASNISDVISAVAKVREEAKLFGVDLICGVEITHVPPQEIHLLARRAKEEGAEVVIVHGESPVEPVAKGTNHAACTCNDVDVLAHPGFITLEEARLAKEHNVALEITARAGHNRTNGYVLMTAKKAGCTILVNSDAHSPSDLMDSEARTIVARGAGLSPDEAAEVLSRDVRHWLRHK